MNYICFHLFISGQNWTETGFRIAHARLIAVHKVVICINHVDTRPGARVHYVDDTDSMLNLCSLMMEHMSKPGSK